jgi:ABC-type nitrate/sulfonate/bicarbonate transport system substrate-binding protein
VVLQRGGITPTSAQWPHYIAEARGLYAAEALSVDTSQLDPASTINALIGGSVDVSFADATRMVLAIDRGADLVAVGTGQDRTTYMLIAPADIKSIAELKGKKIAAVAAADAYTTVIKQILARGGLDPETDVEFIYGGSSAQRATALTTGAIQAGLVPVPQNQEMLNQGFNSLAFTPDYYPDLTLSTTVVRRSWAQQNGDVVRRYLRAQAAASTWLNDPANRDEAIQILAQATRTSPEASGYAYDQTIVRTLSFPNDACVRRPGMESLLKILSEQGQLTTLTAADADRVIDTEWCPR